MKECTVCHQQLSEDVALCPICGEKVQKARSEFEGYHIIEFLGDVGGVGFYRVADPTSGPDLLLRVYEPRDALTPDQIQRFRELLEAVNQIDSEHLVRSSPLKQAASGEWYRISEWVEVISWGDLMSSGFFTDPQRQAEALRLYRQLALALHVLHKNGLLNPELTHDDWLLYRDGKGNISVKLDYKYSQFIQNLSPVDHLSDERVKSCHPDFIAKRPLDARSDIWSLGYFIIALLSNNKEIGDYAEAAGQLAVHQKLGLLLRQMVDPDPDLRPSSLETVAKQLGSITDRDLAGTEEGFAHRQAEPWREMRQLSRLMIVLAFLLLVALGGGIWITLNSRKDETARMMEYASRYNRSMAFVAVEYGLSSASKNYRAIASGTAFLVDRKGHLLSNRHVVCPWTEDQSFAHALGEIMRQGEQPLFVSRHLLWFEGEKAFKKASVLNQNAPLQDHFYVDTAYRSDGEPAVRLLGVLPEPRGLGQRIRSPLGDDAAVLKIDRVPAGLEPLPLATPNDLDRIGNLAPVMVLGFPLSIEAQEDNRVKSNSTMGHVRRNYPAVIQINASIHSGNSGGPVISLDGKVIGIATAVKTSRGFLVSSGLSDFGLIFPISRALPLLETVRAGKAAWDGLIDPALPSKLKAIENAAREGQWKEALAAVSAGIKERKDPRLFYLAGLLYLAYGDWSKAKESFQDLSSIVGEEAMSRFFLYLCDWLGKKPGESDQQYLLQRNWQSSGEYFGFLTRVLSRQVPVEDALDDYDDRNEKVQVRYVAALVKERQGDLAMAERLLREGVLSAEADEPNALLLGMQLKRIQEQRLALFRNTDQRQIYVSECRQFLEQLPSVHQQQEVLANKNSTVRQSLNGLEENDTSDSAVLTETLKKKLELYKSLRELDPEAHYTNLLLGFVDAELGDWTEAGKWLDAYLSAKGREHGNRLAAGLLRAQINSARGSQPQGAEPLRAFAQRVSDPWYRDVARCLLGEIPAEQLIKHSEDNPPEKITLQVALGIQMEQKGEKERAIQHYSEALESYLDSWMEFEYARTRIVLLRGGK